ncbi:hypothetical protein A3I18_02300 [Candidatus Campbellbacteria bacterium RIFCSPLOWO2_02_FULL_35_11]|uniref:Uncharacterized protein n=1 Tax=Candidatus Campbellbacteria bacterium RIFCSPLOWO2_02_FULL_35_11 TaxID=1797581 RepID=A0A1F5ERY0_9BACT|nr:MAG: hypothetical protein A3I18_02300 [Candidatus Campbellbacteria bacterium RIFCSPLOWO2_02_FULL_35_11]
MTTRREEALLALAESPLFQGANSVDKEDMIVRLIVDHFGRPEDIARLCQRDRSEASYLAEITGERMFRNHFVN